MMMRLDRFIAENSPHSRSEAKKLIGCGRVLLNDKPIKSANTKICASSDIVRVDESIIHAFEHLYIMLNKPNGFVSARTDAQHPTVLDLLDKTYANYLNKIQIVGRLDIDTTGLLLLTTDGDWNHRITSPNSKCSKTYLVEVAEALDASYIEQFNAGIHLKNDEKATKPAALDILSAYHAKITLSEGRYHQVKRMFAAKGNRVTKLQRIQIGNLLLDQQLKPGTCRALNTDEVQLFG